jgi:hypothetical protein
MLPNEPRGEPGAFEDPLDLQPPASTPNPRIAQDTLPGSDPGELREMVDKEKVSPLELSIRQQRARHLAAIKENPFIGLQDQSSFPRVPDDDPEWAYLWVRHFLPPTPGERGEVDTKNIADKMTHGLFYEAVRLNDLPEDWRPRMGAYRGKVDGVDGAGHIVYRDLILCRTSRALRDQKQEANDYYARMQRREVHEDVRDKAARGGFLAKKAMDERQDGFVDDTRDPLE